MKKLTTIIILSLLASCAVSDLKKEVKRSAKAQSASERINSSEENSKNILNELDE